MPCVDFIVMGEAEDGCDSPARTALLPNNPRRALRRPIMLSSNNSRASGFTLPSAGLTSSKGDATAPTDALPDTEPAPASSTDFVLCMPDGADLVSDHARCTHFVTNGLCSTKITNNDIVWMEKVADLSPGTLFKHLRESSTEAPSACELPWEPTSRYAALRRQDSLPGTKRLRGSKTTQHLEENRRSDPLVHVWAWHDWHAEYAKVQASHAARIHQQALIDRAFHAHARRVQSDEAAKANARAAVASAKAKVSHTSNPNNPNTAKDKLARGERVSSDSVIALLDIEAAKAASELHPSPSTSPTNSATNSPYTKSAMMGEPMMGERSPGSVFAMQGDFEKGEYTYKAFALDDEAHPTRKGGAAAPTKQTKKAPIPSAVEWSSWHVVDNDSTVGYSDS